MSPHPIRQGGPRTVMIMDPEQYERLTNPPDVVGHMEQAVFVASMLADCLDLITAHGPETVEDAAADYPVGQRLANALDALVGPDGTIQLIAGVLPAPKE